MANFEIQSEEEQEDDEDAEYGQEDFKRGNGKIARKVAKGKRKTITTGLNGIRVYTRESRLVMKQQAAQLPQALRELSKKRSRSPIQQTAAQTASTSVGTANPFTSIYNTSGNRLPIHLRTELEL